MGQAEDTAVSKTQGRTPNSQRRALMVLEHNGGSEA